ncbi:hypothetical protein Tco_0070665 [Tanacetum coccineum]
MACSIPHSDDEIQVLVQKQIDEDMVHQKAILDLALQFDNACTTKEDLRKAYEKCNHIPQESRALIDTFLKEGSDKDYELNLSMYRKAAKLEKQMNAKLQDKLRKTEATAAAKAKGDDNIDSLVQSRAKKRSVLWARLARNGKHHSDLRNQTDEQGPPLDLVKGNKESIVGGEKGNGDDNANVIIEGHGDTADNLSGLRTQPMSRVESVKKPMRDKAPLDAEARKLLFMRAFALHGLTYSSRMVGSREYRDMMSNLFTSADYEFFNDGVPDGSAIKRSWKLLCQSAHQQANTFLRFEAPTEEHADLLKEALKQSEDDPHQLRLDKERYAVECGNGEMVRRRIINEYLPTFVCRLHQSVEYKRSLGEVFSLAVGKSFIDGLLLVEKDEDVSIYSP